MVFNETSLSPERKICENILAILHGFSFRLNGGIKHKTQVKEDSDLPEPLTQ